MTHRRERTGSVEGELIATAEPLSFWGGYDPETGEILDRRHPLSGRRAAACVLALPATRGSSTTTAVLLEAIRRGTAPAAVLTRGVDRFLALAAIAATELYGRSPPVVALEDEDFRAVLDLADGPVRARVDARGAVRLEKEGGLRLDVSGRAAVTPDPPMADPSGSGG